MSDAKIEGDDDDVYWSDEVVAMIEESRAGDLKYRKERDAGIEQLRRIERRDDWVIWILMAATSLIILHQICTP